MSQEPIPLANGMNGSVHSQKPAKMGLGTLKPTPTETISRFFKHITGDKPNTRKQTSSLRKRSYFLSLTHPDVTQALADIDTLIAGCDAIELRVDLLNPSGLSPTSPNVPPAAYVASQVADLRQCTSLPIIFTVRTISQGGMFPNPPTGEVDAFKLMELGVRLGCEYIDVEVSWSPSSVDKFKGNSGNSQIIASWHDWSGNMHWNGEDVRARYSRAAGVGDIVKIVGKASRIEDNFELRKFVASVNVPEKPPIIAINMGEAGQMSRILNETLTPVTHSLLPSKAAPGQLSVAQIQRALHLLGLSTAKEFYLIGSPIKTSMSPKLHNTGFEVLGLPHRYGLVETDTVQGDLANIFDSPTFGGASVTIPLKLDVIPLLDGLSPHAGIIGAVNTVIPRVSPDGTRQLYGDNTDWVAIAECAMAGLTSQPPSTVAALIIGAGGTARAAVYAMRHLGVAKLFLYNRTRKAAEQLVWSFPSDYDVTIVDSLESLPSSPAIIVSTVPAAATSLEKTSGCLQLTEALFTAPEGGVVIDMAYRPAETPLLRLANSIPGRKWSIVKGVDVLLAQGYKQFELWTGMHPPREEIRQRVMDAYEAS